MEKHNLTNPKKNLKASINQIPFYLCGTRYSVASYM